MKKFTTIFTFQFFQLNRSKKMTQSRYLMLFLITCILIQLCYQQDQSELVDSLIGPTISSNSSCRTILGVGHPSNVFKIYFQQIMNNFFVNSDVTKVDLMFYKEERSTKSLHKFIFRMKNVYSKQIEHLGIISMVPQSEFDSKNLNHNIVRYVNAKDFEIVKVLLGIENLKEDDKISCGLNRETFISSIIDQPIAPFDCNSLSSIDRLDSFDVKNMFRYNFDVIRRVVALFKFDIKTSDLLFNKKVIKELKENYSNATIVKKDLDILDFEINSLNEVNHNELLEKSYNGSLLRCQDDFDITKECNLMKNNQCISLEEAERIFNLMIIYYMINTKTILSLDLISKIKNQKFIIRQIALNKLGILSIYETISNMSNNKSEEKSYNRYGISSQLDLQFLNEMRTKFFNEIESDFGINWSSNEVLMNELKIISDQLKFEIIHKIKELGINLDHENFPDQKLVSNKQILKRIKLKKTHSNFSSGNKNWNKPFLKVIFIFFK